MRLPPARAGKRVDSRQRVVDFSFWPATLAHKNRYKVQHTLFALDPWSIIEGSISRKCPAAAKEEAQACLRQARDFFQAANQAGTLESRPLSLYYSYMNLVKAFCLTRGQQPTFDKAQHGLSEQLRAPNVELVDAYLAAFPSPSKKQILQNFDEFLRAVTGKSLPASFDYELTKLLPQTVSGHRLWCLAEKADERMFPVESIQYWKDSQSKTAWLRITLKTENLTRHGMTRSQLLKRAGLNNDFRMVSQDPFTDKVLTTLEMKVPIPVTGYASDKVQELSKLIKDRIWSVVSTVPPYRKYYLYACPPTEQPHVLPQLLSIYAISYYLGSITRYRPHQLPKISQGTYGPLIQDFITGQPMQFLYLMASEFSEQDVAKPAIVLQ
uniref:YaaC domain-containing protein n=1 Tax=Pseudomonas aeruginosa TaxID=287 RepID=A0A7L9E6Y6_PSEAI|nr:YaaC family protein [Pseudomonas aeruginosa]QOJ62940.1 YaaC domain-containing protein [Pseudomonas aeruginosa]QOJ63493.1 YaaC domain-containing protein [Pseudomonas aeruginosa]QOJ66772.1 YaaC domain-containing protein [Pseudomonas aeruginosa]